MLYSSTVLARNASSILAHISRLPASLTSHPLLFTLSTNAPAPSLAPLVSALSSFSSSGSVGCLSAPTNPGATGVSAAPIACSLAFFRKEHSVPFRSDIPGRPETQVGRWHAMRRTSDQREESIQGGEVELKEDVEWEKIWGRRTEGDVIPPALEGLGKNDVHTIITLTDNAPQGLNDSLSSFPLATKLGLFCSSTPFVTGRPYTLIFNGSVTSSGAVGIALSAGRRPTLRTAFPGLRAITPPLKVTRSEGNLVNELDNRNPTALLVSAIAESALVGKAGKDDAFYLGVLRDGELWQIHRITSGAPSRGTMALESEIAPREGSSVQLFYCPEDIAAPPHATAKNTLTFVAVPQFESALAGQGDDTVTVLEDTFLAASENGFMLSRENEMTGTCITPGAQARLAW
ncbi:hypothetical protein F5888DRAFT_1615424 [Russula emetica]|nr:hypothetical protein F5888DRAFT_1615424 [Russula emetica]